MTACYSTLWFGFISTIFWWFITFLDYDNVQRGRLVVCINDSPIWSCWGLCRNKGQVKTSKSMKIAWKLMTSIWAFDCFFLDKKIVSVLIDTTFVFVCFFSDSFVYFLLCCRIHEAKYFIKIQMFTSYWMVTKVAANLGQQEMTVYQKVPTLFVCCNSKEINQEKLEATSTNKTITFSGRNIFTCYFMRGRFVRSYLNHCGVGGLQKKRSWKSERKLLKYIWRKALCFGLT